MSDDNVLGFRTPERIEDPAAQWLRIGARQPLRRRGVRGLAAWLTEYPEQRDAARRRSAVVRKWLPARTADLTGPLCQL